MSQKNLKPTLTGQKIRTRKREEKAKKHDPEAFRDELLEGLNQANGNFSEILKFLEQAGHRLEYNKYGETLFEVLLTGNILGQGGLIEETKGWNDCLVHCKTEEQIRSFYDVFEKIMRRYKYLLKIFESHVAHILKFINIWKPNQVENFAKFLGIVFVSSTILTPKVLESLFSDYLVRNDCSLNFITFVFKAWLPNSKYETFSLIMKNSELDKHLLDFFPENKQNVDFFEQHFNNCRLHDVVRLYQQKIRTEALIKLKSKVISMIQTNQSAVKISEIVIQTSEEVKFPENESISLIWSCIMDSIEWSNKSDMLEKQVVQHMTAHAQLLSKFTTTGRSQLNALNIIQQYCYENMTFIKCLRNIILALYNNDVIYEDSIQKWYTDSHISKGWSVFQEQMLALIKWLEMAEEDSS